MDDRLLTIAEAASALGVHPETMYRLCWRGAIPTVRIGSRSVRVSRADLETYVAGRKSRDPPPLSKRRAW